MKQVYTKILFIGLLLMGFSNWGFGQNQNYLDFDGTNDFVRYNNDGKLQGMNGATNYTIEAWVYIPSSAPTSRKIMHRTNQFYIEYFSNNKLSFYVYNGSSYIYYNTVNNAISNDAWHHIAIVRNTSLTHYLHFYIDGVDQISGNYNGYALTSSNTYNLYIGNSSSGTSYCFEGYIDEIRLSAAATSVASLHSNAYDNQYVSNGYTKALLHFNEGTGTTTTNEAYSSSSITLVNGTAWRAWSYESGKHLPLAYEWTGATTDWGTTTNWSSGSLPTSTTDVIIPDVANDPVINSLTAAVAENITIGGPFTVSSGASIEIGGLLTNNGTFTNNGVFNNSGSFINNRTYNDNGTTKFTGSSTQTIPAEAYNNLIIDNSNGVSLAGDVYIIGALTLTDGIVSEGSHAMIMEPSSSVSGASNTAFVDGLMIKIGSSDFVFPIGNVDTLGQIGISNLSASETFGAKYHKSEAGNSSSSASPIIKVSQVEFWEIERAGSATADVTLYWQDSKYSGIGSLTDLRVVHYNGNFWEEQSGTITTTGTASLTTSESGTIKVTGVSSFSPFTFGTVNNKTNPLPVELISFNLSSKDNSINLHWQTATELNNNGFEIQRSEDAENWEKIGFVKGAGNSNTIQNYTFNDNSPKVFNYYRLKQIDFDGKFKYSDIKFLKLGKTLSINISPNPVANILNIDVDNAKQIDIYDVAGKLVKQYSGSSQSIDVSDFTKGVYFFIVTKNDGTQVNGKFMKN